MDSIKLSVVVILSLAALINAEDLDVEIHLSRYGYYNPFAFDSSSNLNTAIKEYQNFHQLKETGLFDSQTKAEMLKPRCGLPDVNINKHGYYATRSKWRRTDLTYAYTKLGNDLPINVLKMEMEKAFNMWSAVTPLTFKEVSGRGNINIGWHTRYHGDNGAFDGSGGVLAHAYFPENGRLHFDDHERWAVNGARGTDLLWVAVHEIGHALGLDHSRVRGAIMWPTYYGYQRNLKLSQDDINGIRRLYGAGTGTGGGTVVTQPPPPPGGNCDNKDNKCDQWAKEGSCTVPRNWKWMKGNCCKACGGETCTENSSKCQEWAKRGDCNDNSLQEYMLFNCKKACGKCT